MTGVVGWEGFPTVAGASAAVIVIAQAVTFLVGIRTRRFAVADVTWGLGFVPVAVVCAVLGGGDLPRRVLLATLTAAWGLRLARHIHRRSRGRGEDPRYEAMLPDANSAVGRPGSARAGAAAAKIFLPQAAAQWVISLPLQAAAVTDVAGGPGTAVVLLGALVWLAGMVFESLGDAQLRRFTADPDRSGILDTGLWAWTRHPNYFGDACVWWGLWLCAATAWPGAITIIAPVLMTGMLVFGTGARLLEKSMSQRPGYTDYQTRTSFFLPLPPRR